MAKGFSGLLALTALVSGISLNTPINAQVAQSGYSLPLQLAMEAAAEAIRTCGAAGCHGDGRGQLRRREAVGQGRLQHDAALGIGGSPGGNKDEASAEAGVAKIRGRVTLASGGNAAKTAGN